MNAEEDGAGDGAAGGGNAGETLARDGDVRVGVAIGVVFVGEGAGSVVVTIGFGWL